MLKISPVMTWGNVPLEKNTGTGPIIQAFERHKMTTKTTDLAGYCSVIWMRNERRSNEKLRAIDKQLKGILLQRSSYLFKQKRRKGAAGCRSNSSSCSAPVIFECQLRQVCYAKARAITRKNWDPEKWYGNIWMNVT